ncbi:MAG: hypothetical protein WCF18_06345 [Chthoniobacteraceae bacterium]
MIAALVRATGNAALFAGACGLGCLAIGLVLPLPDVPQAKEKLEWFRAHRDEYTALFLGSSRVRRHIIPSLFDRLAAEQGIEMHSFNLGMDSLAAPEDAYVLDQALAAAPPRLRYVFIELTYFRANFAGQGADTIRSAYWHDWERTCAVWRRLASEEWQQIKPPKKRKKQRWSGWLADVGECLDLFATHGRLFLQRATNLGRGAGCLQKLTGLRPPGDPLAPLGPARDGFIPSDTVMNAASLSEYQRQLSSLKTTESRTKPLDRVPQENLEAMLARVRAHGAEPVLFIAPTPGGAVLYPRREVAPLLDFSDPLRWPSLFDPQYRADVTHLNTAGAEVFTRALFSAAKLSAQQR